MSKLSIHMWSNLVAKQSHPLRGKCLDHIWSKSTVQQSPPTRGICLDHIWSKSTVRQSPSMRGTFWTTFGQSPLHDKVLWQGAQFGPHLVKVCCMTKSSNKGHNLGHIWLKSAAWQSPPMKGTFWATFGWSPLRDKVLQWGAQFKPNLVKVCSETKSSNEGQFFCFCHIWLLSTAWQLCPMADHGYHSLATFDQSPLCDTSSDEWNVFSFLC